MANKCLCPHFQNNPSATILISATTANAAVCSPDVSSSLKQAQYNAMKQDAAQLEPVAKNFMDNINQSLETIGCTDAWPVGNLGISLPSVDSIIKNEGSSNK